ncbi:hypothetical protein [Alloyangia pacifica]|uniref:hypothetical protein n=1 Tax=Alloyangia pacifica TaxID=311180 RepID=UPI001CD48EE5|nr:hypothetical protein [Alloyangia pacifica]MCA0996840.1 hypothetical protein [Alloyangia pacifica]
MRFLILILFLSIVPAFVSAQDSEGVPDPIFSGERRSSGPLVVQDGSQVSPAFRAAMEQHAIRTFEWQLAVSNRVMWLVIVLSAAGVIFSAIQLLHLFPVCLRTPKMRGGDVEVLAARVAENLGGNDAMDTSQIKRAVIAAVEAGSSHYFSGQRENAEFPVGNAPETKLYISEGKLEITTGVAGIFVLIISLGSLYLFLRFVYSIDVVII